MLPVFPIFAETRLELWLFSGRGNSQKSKSVVSLSPDGGGRVGNVGGIGQLGSYALWVTDVASVSDRRGDTPELQISAKTVALLA